ncbi:MAG: AMP-dependent synthetase/ligase [Promethearchaeota archaeon]
MANDFGNKVHIIRFLIDSEAKYGEMDCMLYLKRGEYVNITWSETLKAVKMLSLGLQSLGVERGDRIALMSKTRYEWRLLDYAILCAGGVVTTIYPSLTSAQVEYIINDSNSSIIVVDKENNLKKVLKVYQNCPNLKYAIYISPISSQLKEQISSLGESQLKVLNLDELVELGGRYERSNIKPSSEEALKVLRKINKTKVKIRKLIKFEDENKEKIRTLLNELYELNKEYGNLTRDPFINRYLEIEEQDLCTIVYTSGTTGVPKGAMLTHYNMAHNAEQALQVIPLKQHDIALSFLPLSHVLERQVGQFMATLIGFAVAYARDTDSLIENLNQIKPTFMVSVPRLYEKLYDRVIADVLEEKEEEGEETTKEKMFNKMCDWGWEYQKTKQEVNLGRRYNDNDKVTISMAIKNFIADQMLFKKIRDILGGRLCFMFSGGAALNPIIARFFFAAGFKILEGYGLTETSPVLTVNRMENIRFGTVGLPIPETKIKIAQDGEILAQGPQVFQGYWNKPNENAAAFSEDEEGKWFHTGDLGEFDEEGYLKITGRKKTVIVLRTGKKVSPVVTEAAIQLDRHVSHVCVIGDDMKYLVGIIEPNFEYLAEWLKKNQLMDCEPEDFELYKGMSKEEFEKVMALRKKVIQMPEVIQFYQKILDETQQNLSEFERVKRFALVPDEWNEYNVMTPSMKIKRRVIYEKYKNLIDQIYVE